MPRPFHKQINKRLCQVYPRYSDAALIGAVCSLPTLLPASCDLSAAPLIDTTTFTLNIPGRQTPSTHMAYKLVSRDHGPLTFPSPIFLIFGFSGRYLDSSLRCDIAQPMSLFQPEIQSYLKYKSTIEARKVG